MKGVSSVIAIILLLLITISVVATASIFFISGAEETLDSAETSLSAQKEKSSSVIKVIDSTENTITVKNLGSNPVDIEDINIVGGGNIVDITNSGTIASGQSAILTTELLISGTNYSLVGNFIDVNFIPEYESCEDMNDDGDYLDSGEASFSGSGTSSDPYQILLPCQLYGVRHNLSSEFLLMTDIDLNTFDHDSNSANGNWIPIGDATSRFTGTFDGNGYRITNLIINNSNLNLASLFGYATNATLKNIELVDVNITGNAGVGGIAGQINNGTISNSSVTGNITGTREVGGIVGQNSFFEANISNSYTNVNVTGSVTNIGGLVGRNINAAIFNSYSIGSVTGSGNVGGLAGENTNTVCTNSYWNTQTSGQSTSACGTGQTTSQLQSPTSATGIYSTWLTSIWNFGTSSEYPRLR